MSDITDDIAARSHLAQAHWVCDAALQFQAFTTLLPDATGQGWKDCPPSELVVAPCSHVTGGHSECNEQPLENCGCRNAGALVGLFIKPSLCLLKQ